MTQPAGYSQLEERINIVTHLVGAILAVLATLLMVLKSASFAPVYVVSVVIFGVSMVILFSASTLYHSATQPDMRARLRVFDHCAIFVFIAGSYTPFALLVLEGAVGWWIFGVSWGLAAAGVILKIFFTGRFKLLSTGVYLFMGWIVIFVINTLLEKFTSAGFGWLLAGGVAYTVGAVLYSFKKLSYTHASFHVMVMVGCACHFQSVYSYILV